jgi:hypothetical protein
MPALPQPNTPQQGLNITSQNAPGVTSVGGFLQLRSLAQTLQDEKNQAVQVNSTPVIQGIAAYVRHAWSEARRAKEITIEPVMLQGLRARKGEYDPDKLALLQSQGSSLIYMMLTSNKCRAASSWIRDVLITTSEDKPWTIKPSATPDIDPSIQQSILQQATQIVAEFHAQGHYPPQEDIKQLLVELRSVSEAEITSVAQDKCDLMEKKMEDQLQNGHWSTQFSLFIDDLVTFPAAFMKGPVVRKKPKMEWKPDGKQGYQLSIQDDLVLEWERVDPFYIYPSADAIDVDDGYLCERHRLSRGDLNALIGVDGYSEDAIRAVLDEYGRGGLHEWIRVDTEKAMAEGRSTAGVHVNPSELIDAVQFWGSVQGRMLLDWGMETAPDVNGGAPVPLDPLAEYPIEAWLIGAWIIKAVINPDPLGRRPYYKASYEIVPGAFWGNSVPFLCRDAQDVCNAAARALVNNMGISSGPQVVVNVDRLPEGEDITQLYPWKVWQVTSDPMAGTQLPINFFNPSSMSQELMNVYDRFSVLADEYTGIPRYMTGDSAVGGAGRTASGMSMMLGNAGKSIKQVIATVDLNVIEKAIDRLYYYNMRYSTDPDLKGDIDIIAQGATLIAVKEQYTMRREQFLQVALANPVVNQVVGMDGIAELLRESAKQLGMNTDRIVPPVEILKLKWMQQQQQAMQQQQAQAQAMQQNNGQAQAGGTPPAPPQPGAVLENGAPVTNNFSNEPQKN